MDASSVPFLNHPGTAWLVAAVALMLLEALGIPGVGLLFAGLGALVTGAAVYTEMVGAEAYVIQFAIFFLASALWAVLLWKPMQHFRTQRSRGSYSNIVGDVAIVAAGGLSRELGGNVTWSGTIMKAELASGPEALPEGAQVVITDVKGATLLVREK